MIRSQTQPARRAEQMNDSSAARMCSCPDTSCPMHPSNHDMGCTLCVAKNLKLGEIPTCFFSNIPAEKPTSGWKVSDFARLVEKAENEGKII